MNLRKEIRQKVVDMGQADNNQGDIIIALVLVLA